MSKIKHKLIVNQTVSLKINHWKRLEGTLHVLRHMKEVQLTFTLFYRLKSAKFIFQYHGIVSVCN